MQLEHACVLQSQRPHAKDKQMETNLTYDLAYRNGQVLYAFGYIAASVCLGLAATFIGFAFVKHMPFR